MTQITIVTGSAGVGKTERLLHRYGTALERARTEKRPGTTLWLTPTRRIQKEVAQRVLGVTKKVSFASNVLTFELFAEKILEEAGRPATPISPVVKRLLLRRIVSELLESGELRYFEPIASTTGFLDVVSNFISDLKREEIWPEEFVAACRDRKSAFARRDLELGLIYDHYQDKLSEQNWYDNEGRFWLARTAIAEGVRGRFASLKFVAVDGFVDFTQTQYEILGHMAGWIDEILISLPVESPVRRPELFSKSQAAIARIRDHLPTNSNLKLEPLHASPGGQTATHHNPIRRDWPGFLGVIADGLFSNPRLVQPSTAGKGLEVIAATGQFGEWEAIAHRIKQMLAGDRIAPVRPQDIVVGLRAISEDGPRLSAYLAAAGLPVWCEAEPSLASSSVVKTVMALLQFELEDWPFERLLNILDSTFFRSTWPERLSGQAARAAATALRRLRIHTGRELMLRVMARHANETGSDSVTRSDSLTGLARLAYPLLARLSRALERLRRSHTLNDWADVLATIGEDLGWANSKTHLEDELTVKEANELDLLQRIIRTAADADQKMASRGRPRLLALTEFATELRDLLSHETLNSPPDNGGCVRILSVEQIRNLDVPHLFLIGLTENSFPMNRPDDCLFSESERQEFVARGIALRHRSSQHVDEMSLFYTVVTRARQSLTLSYPAVNSKGQPVFPSPYVTALTSLFAPHAILKTEEGQLDPVPSLDRVLSPTDLRLASMTEARHGRPQLYRAVLESDQLRKASWNSLAACEVADQRFHQRGFTPYEGLLQLPQNVEGLRQRFGANHQFSATELESYARCPFQFWLSVVLKISPMDSLEEGTDYAARGTMLHTVLAQLLSEGQLSDPASLSRRFLELVESQLDRRVSETELQRALVTVERSILERWADAFVAQQSEYDQIIGEFLKGFRSLAPEIPFGKLPDDPMASSEAHPPIQFGQCGNVVNLRGRIDRVDLGSYEGQPAYVVVDYKTGQRPVSGERELIAGRSIQLALYLLAIKRLGLVGADAVPLQMGYWVLQDTGFKPGIGRAKLERISSEKLNWLESVLDQLLPQLAEEIRSGRFVVENEDVHCTGRCPYSTVCRVNQLRPLAATLGKRSAPRIDPDAFELSDDSRT
jgi:ATP-dependent helicase/nuclease subunit B